MKLKGRIFPYVLYSFYAFGVIGHALTVTRSLVIALTPYVLVSFGLLAVYLATDGSPRRIAWCAAVYVFAFAIEALGVATGRIFGQYAYGATLGGKVLGVPPVIGLNWVLAVLGAIAIARMFSRNPVIMPLGAAGLTVIFDLPLEIVAVRLDYWQWAGGMVPFQNYLAWFLISFLVAAAYQQLKVEIRREIVSHYFIVQFFFFLAIVLLRISLV